ncbi:MAG: hypothetical protein AAB116_07585 [Candidatus Poribacteria bacterium]
MEILNEESEQIKEVFAHFGLAMYIAQGLERTLGIALATVYGPGPQKITKSEYENLLESNFQKTLGKLINDIRKTVEVSEALESMLFESLKKRNCLAHNYFWERAIEFTSRNGRELMIRELIEIKNFLENVDSIFMEINEKWAEKHGVTKEILEATFNKLIGNE